MPRFPAAPIDPGSSFRRARRCGWIIAAAMVGLAALAGCQSTMDGQAGAAATVPIDQQPSTSAAGQVPLTVPIELRGVQQEYQCTAAGSTSVPPTTPGFGPSSPPGTPGQSMTVMHDLFGTDCYTVTAPLLVLQSLTSIDAAQQTGSTGNWVIDLRLTPADTRSFARLTQSRSGSQIALVVRGSVVSAPTLEQPITNGAIEIAGNFSQDDAKRLVRQLTG